MKTKKLPEAKILQITNDIAEGIDNRQTLAQLRQCVSYWARAHYRAVAEVTTLKQQLLIVKIVGALSRNGLLSDKQK